MVSLAAWAVQVLYEAASAEKVGLMLDSGLLPGLEYVRVLTPSSVCGCGRRRHSVRSCGASGSALARSAALQAKHAESLAVAVKVARVLTRLCEQVTHTRTLSHTLSHTHMRAPTCTHMQAHAFTHTRAHAHRRIQAGRQGWKDHDHTQAHARAHART